MSRKPKSKPKFRVGQKVNLPVVILKIDRIDSRYMFYSVQSTEGGWVFSDPIAENELRPLTRREKGN